MESKLSHISFMENGSRGFTLIVVANGAGGNRRSPGLACQPMHAFPPIGIHPGTVLDVAAGLHGDGNSDISPAQIIVSANCAG